MFLTIKRGRREHAKPTRRHYTTGGTMNDHMWVDPRTRLAAKASYLATAAAAVTKAIPLTDNPTERDDLTAAAWILTQAGHRAADDYTADRPTADSPPTDPAVTTVPTLRDGGRP